MLFIHIYLLKINNNKYINCFIFFIRNATFVFETLETLFYNKSNKSNKIIKVLYIN